MEPIGIEQKGQECVIHHRCVICGEERRNKAAPDDNVEAVIRVMQQQAGESYDI